jgi:hypothetical protein
MISQSLKRQILRPSLRPTHFRFSLKHNHQLMLPYVKSITDKTQQPSLPVTQIQPAETFESASGGMRLSAPPSSEVAPGSHALGAASDSGVNIIDHSVPASLDDRSPALATFVAGDDAITAYRQGSAVVLADGTQIFTAQPGSAVTIGSHTINIADDGHALIISTSTVEIPSHIDLEGDISAAVHTPDGPVSTAIETTALQYGQQLSASAAENGIIVQQGTSLVTLAAGQQTDFNGHTLSAVQSGSALIVDGSGMTIAPTGTEDNPSKNAETASDGRSANAAGVTSATNTEEVTTNTPSTPQSSAAQEDAALGSMANTNLYLRLLCLVVCVYASVALV